MRLAAMIGLAHAGKAPEQAADQLKVDGEERAKLLALLPGYVAAPTPEPKPVDPTPVQPTPPSDPPAKTDPPTDARRHRLGHIRG